jgi:hypothetical protein
LEFDEKDELKSGTDIGKWVSSISGSVAGNSFGVLVDKLKREEI